ncbi:MAG TPA: EutN/CcmL family microcompartment protein [Symbiobacteriaceae bacterium]|nr:EutN/CcmL family microcompartment protein [Symbiobacteriaceae bacterium]
MATQKDPKLAGRKLLVVEPIKTDGTPAGKPAIAVDLVGAGAGETVLLAKSRDASLAAADAPIDLAIIGIADALVTPPHQPISPAERGFRSC